MEKHLDRNDFRTTHAVIPAKFTLPVNKKPAKPPVSEPLVNKPTKHVIHRAMEWEEMLNTGEAASLAQIARENGISRARVSQIMNLLKLPADVKEFLARLQDPMEIQRYSERRLRKNLLGKTTVIRLTT